MIDINHMFCLGNDQSVESWLTKRKRHSMSTYPVMALTALAVIVAANLLEQSGSFSHEFGYWCNDYLDCSTKLQAGY